MGISMTFAYVAGICGSSNASSIINCYNVRDISAMSTGRDISIFAGGICSNSINGSSIDCCYNTGNITADGASGVRVRTAAGGISGHNVASSITNCYNIGNCYLFLDEYETFALMDYAGGICGGNEGEISSCYNTGSVYASYPSIQLPYFTSASCGSICGANYSSGVIVNCYWNSDSEQLGDWNQNHGIALNFGIASIVALTNAEMRNQENFKEFEFDTIWKIDLLKNEGYPILQCFNYDTIIRITVTKTLQQITNFITYVDVFVTKTTTATSVVPTTITTTIETITTTTEIEVANGLSKLNWILIGLSTMFGIVVIVLIVTRTKKA